jgi:hypothetical protein
MHQLLDQIVGAAKSGMHLVAIGMASAVPDICAALASEDGRSTKERYGDWCNAYLIGRNFGVVTAEDLYSIRCGVLHQGRFGDLRNNVERVIFTPPGNISFKDCRIEDAYVYGVVEFCENICAAAREWYDRHCTDPIIKQNSARMMRYHAKGLAPYISGVEVIA